MFQKIILALSFCMLSLFAASIEIKDSYVRAVPPSLPNSASFMRILNNSDNTVQLVAANSDAALHVELHEHIMENGMMKMQQISHIAIAPHSETILQPGGLHVMLLGLKKPLKAGDMVTIELIFSNNETITLHEVPVKSVMMGMQKK
ncbi:MAG: copper chaperone PCu(A)C [Sulfurospirillum sp.]|nr:copper chaperone PCu(A)C [Sulfurospirillum sp.]